MKKTNGGHGTGLPSHVKPSARRAYEASTTTPRVRDGGTLDGLGGAGNGKSWVWSWWVREELKELVADDISFRSGYGE